MPIVQPVTNSRKKAVGPALKGVSAKYDKEWLYSWIKNSAAMIKAGDAQAVAIWEEYNRTAMNAFPQLSNQDIDNIIAYTDYIPPAPAATAAGPVARSSCRRFHFKRYYSWRTGTSLCNFSCDVDFSQQNLTENRCCTRH